MNAQKPPKMSANSLGGVIAAVSGCNMLETGSLDALLFSNHKKSFDELKAVI
jgi:hypothetical protein